MQNRFKSKWFWAGVFCIIGLVLNNYGLYDALHMPEGTFTTIVKIGLDLIFGSGAAISAANNPTDPNNF